MFRKYFRYVLLIFILTISFLYINNWLTSPIYYDIKGNAWIACLDKDSLKVIPLDSNASFKNWQCNCFVFSEDNKLIKNRANPFYKDFAKKKIDIIVYCTDLQKLNNAKDSLGLMEKCLIQIPKKLCWGYEFNLSIKNEIYYDSIEFNEDSTKFLRNNQNLIKLVKPNSIIIVYTNESNIDGKNGYGFSLEKGKGVALIKAFDPILILHEMIHALDLEKGNPNIHSTIPENKCYQYIYSENYVGCNFAFQPSKLPRLYTNDQNFLTFKGNETFLLPSTLKPDSCICDRINDILNVFHVDTTSVIEFANKFKNEENFRIEVILAMNSKYPNIDKFRSNSIQTYNHLFLPEYEKYGFWGNAASSDDDNNNVTKEQFIDITTKGILELRKANATLILRHLLPDGFKTPTDQLLSAYFKMINKKFEITLKTRDGSFTQSLLLGTKVSNFDGSRLSVELRYDGTILVTNPENEILFNRNIGVSNLKAIDVKTYCHFTEYQIKLSVNNIDEVYANNVRITPISNLLRLNKIPNSLTIRYKNIEQNYPIDIEKFYKKDECTFSYHKTIAVTNPNYSLAFDNATTSRIENLKITNKDIQGNTNKFANFFWPNGKIKTTFEINYNLKGSTKMDTTLLTLEQKDFNNVMKYNVKLNLPATFDYHIVWDVRETALISLKVYDQDITAQKKINLPYTHKNDISLTYCYKTKQNNQKICKTILIPIKEFVQLDNNNYFTYKITSAN